jgi:hypothetical protein
MVVTWLLDGVARGSEGADVLVVVVRWCCGGRWVVRVRTRVGFVSVLVVLCNGVGVVVVVMARGREGVDVLAAVV